MRFKVETITPERARKLLDETDRQGFTNRSIRKYRVETLAHAIESGQWRVTHQPIAISASGAVVDGQHRLLAIVAAGEAVDVTVARDADPETFGVIDTGGVRTTADSLKIAGFTDTNVLAALVRGWIAYRQVMGTTVHYTGPYRAITTADVLAFTDDADQRDAAVVALHTGRSVAGYLARYGLATALGITRLSINQTPNELGDATVAEFYARLSDGANLDHSSPILALRRWFMSDTGYARVPNTAKRPTAVAVTLKAINDYALGRPRQVVAYRIGREPFPAPLPKGTRRAWERELEDREAGELVRAGT